ncbi:hypothetical protein R6V09_44145, partial [Streptomyces sp. W16]|uniref:hypothetical protein n=1 Tax=Streptomyces sp. W16 TaxID=3076631 RepID=UPI00295B6C33
MSNQPYEGYGEGYDPYAQQQQPQQAQQQQAQAWPGHQQQAYEDPQAAQQYTQQWQGQTWDTQVQQSRPSASDLAYFPPQNYQAATPSYDPHAQAPVTAPPAATDEAAAGYGPSTLAGNARITDAQRARLEGRSPIIEPGMQPAGLTAVLALLLSVTAQIGSYALVVPLVVLQAVTAAGWFRLNGMWPARQGIALAFAGALVADVALLAAGRDNGPAAILGTLGVWVLLSLVMQLRSHADPDTRITSLMAT